MTTKTESDKIPGFSMMSVIRNGTGAAWPVCIGYLPLGMALGVLAQKSGLTPLQIGLMSVMVFAGSAQFIAISMIQGGTSPAAIIFTVFMVNFRHFLMSSALAVPLKGVNRLFLSFFAYGITDESFAVNITRFRKGAWDKWRALTVHHTANITWILSTVFGGAAGRFIPAGALGIDYALPGMFIALLVSQLQGRAYIFTGALAAVTAVFWKLLFPGDSYIVSAAVIAATGGYFVRRYLRKGEEAVT